MDASTNTIIFKTSGMKGRSPRPEDLAIGEIAINTHSGTIYSKDKFNNVFIFGTRTPLVVNASEFLTQKGIMSLEVMNETMAIMGAGGCRTEAGNKTVTIFADTVDAIKLGGKLPSFYAEATHLHDERYAPQETKKVDSLSGKNWYRIATNTIGNHAAATFDISTPQHYVRVNAVSQGFTTAALHMLNGYNTQVVQDVSLSRLRVVRTDNGNIGLDVYINSSIETAFSVTMQNDVKYHGGWTLIDPVIIEEQVDVDPLIYTDLDISDPNGYDTTAEIRERGVRVFSTNNKPSWGDVVDVPETFPSSDHSHNDVYYTETEIDAKFNEILDGASEQLSSFKELSDALLENGDAIGALNDSIALKAAKAGDVFTGHVGFDLGARLSVDTMLTFNHDAFTGGTWGISQKSVADGGILAIQLRNVQDVDSAAKPFTTKAYFDAKGQFFVSNGQSNSSFWQVWHGGNQGAGTGLDADLLDGEEGSFYQNAANLIDGTVPIGRLTGTYNIGITGTAKTALNAANAVNLDDRDAAYYLNAANINAGVLSAERLSGSYDIHISGNADTATHLRTPRDITLAGDVSGVVSWDGSGAVTMMTQVADDSHTHDGRYYTEVESDFRFCGTAQEGKNYTLIAGDNSKLVTPPSGYNNGLFNELKRGVSLGLADNGYCSALTIAASNEDAQGGNHQLIFKDGSIVLRYGMRSSGWNDPVKVFTEHDAPNHIQVGLSHIHNYPISDNVDLNSSQYYASAKAVNTVNARVNKNAIALGDVGGAITIPTGAIQTRPVPDQDSSALMRYTNGVGFEGYNPETGIWGSIGSGSSNDDQRVTSWFYVATGGEIAITPPYTFTSARVYLGGSRQSEGYSFSIDNGVIKLADSLIAGEIVEVELGIAPDTLSFDVLSAAKSVADNVTLVDQKVDSIIGSVAEANKAASDAQASAQAAAMSASHYPEMAAKLEELHALISKLHPMF